MNVKSYLQVMMLGMASMYINAAVAAESGTLFSERMDVVRQYVEDLGKADYHHIVTLFQPNGYVVSTSRGKMNAKEFFYAFLPNVKTSQTAIHQIFRAMSDDDRLSTRFHFIFTLKDGDKENGEYSDEFVFAKNSTRLEAVNVFENLHFPK